MKKIIILFTILIGFSLLSSQVRLGSSGTNFVPSDWSWATNGWKNNTSNFSLLNPNNYDMNHSFSFATSYASGESLYQSTYTNHIAYRVNSKLDINLDLHFTNYGSASVSKGMDIESNDDNTNNIVPDFSVEYRPSENTSFQFVYRGATANPYFQRYNYWRD
ncbi:MAG: hypothetical protein B6226_02715 [Candidatus Cloacimonetes bacterium 4572_65]|nr:MAG: hypothetical protein B6226_02715 [Candidatus Cloacimonetes bacterium 4572_65]